MQVSTKDQARFESKIERGNSKDCWEWTDHLDRDGYGSFFLLGKSRRAHRASWFIHRGPIPAGKLIGHTCRNRKCVNPQHLYLTTPAENALENSDSLAAINAQKTHCKQGHPYDKSYESRRGRVRYCSICHNEKKARLRANQGDQLKGLV